MEADGFQLVKSKKAAKRKKMVKPTHNLYCQNAISDSIDQEDVVSKLEAYRVELMTSPLRNSITDALIKSEILSEDASEHRATRSYDLVCYGVGNFASCLVARYQLALCMIFKELLLVPDIHANIFDPVFTEVEKDILKTLDFEVIPENEEGARVATKPTIFYMPHCGKPLYNNLLWSNWSIDLLQNVCIVGNSFLTIAESTPTRFLEEEAFYISKVQPHTHEWDINNVFRYPDIFNNTSVHTFEKTNLLKLPENVWNVMPKPKYNDDVEIITRSDATS